MRCIEAKAVSSVLHYLAVTAFVLGGMACVKQAVDDAMRTHSWQPQPLLARTGDQRYDTQDDADELADLIDELAADTDGWNQR